MTRIGLRLSRAHHARIGTLELQENVAGFFKQHFCHDFRALFKGSD
jgi:hypothetical protein